MTHAGKFFCTNCGAISDQAPHMCSICFKKGTFERLDPLGRVRLSHSTTPPTPMGDGPDIPHVDKPTAFVEKRSTAETYIEKILRDQVASDCMGRMWTQFCDSHIAASQNPKAMPDWAKRTAQMAFVAADAFIEVRREAPALVAKSGDGTM